MLNFLEKNPKGAYNDPNVATAFFNPELELPKIKDKNPKYPALSNCVNFK